VLGVEMASTGEVACFGSDKYEAYLKALMSTGFKIPKMNVLLSIGSYKDKKEMLPSVQKLQSIGYKLFATAGTADFLTDHGIPVQYLEALGDDQDGQKSEFSLTQHLANNMIDLYINLPSNNKYRRPANYMSRGYQTRRMAVDYQIPLVTNVKNAKILVEAIARRYELPVASIDCQTSHRTIVLPGLINVAAFVPGVVTSGSHDLQAVTKASLLAGFTMIRVMPLGVQGAITDAASLKLAQHNGKRAGYCDYNLSISATSTNADEVSHFASEVASLFIPFNHLSGNISKVAAVTAHFDSWPTNKPIVTDAKLTDLASILLLASLHNRKIHVTSVTAKDDIKLIALAKAKGLQVTCDVSVYSLYLSQREYPNCDKLPTVEDQEALWAHLSTIDVFSIGSLPFHVASTKGEKPGAAVGIADALPLLLTSVVDGRLTVDDIKTRLYDQPMAIFELHEQRGTSVEIEFDRPYRSACSQWSPVSGRSLSGFVQRVNFQDKAVCLDGELLPVEPQGKDMSTHRIAPASPKLKALHSTENSGRRRLSSVSSVRPALKPKPYADGGAHHASPFLTAPTTDAITPSPSHQPLRTASLRDLLTRPSPFKASDVLSVKQYSRADLHLLFTVAQEMRLGVQRDGVLDVLRGRVLCTLFYEPSTRTSASFDTAMQRLGGRTVAIATSQSSIKKGETLQDTLRTLASYADAVVLRHPEESSADIAHRYCPVPVINGGNGSKEHPTQAFLDLFTIREELGTVQGLTITFLGDLLYGRTVHSLIYLLSHYDVRIQLVSPTQLSLPTEIREQLVKSGQLVCESETLTPEIVARSDVLYCTRVQQERFASEAEYDRVKGSYRIDNATLQGAKSNMVILHPLPRNDEISEEVDFDNRAAYFRQMRYGLWCRMALLALVMSQ
jgi:carbamoyl-phosphate synthase/aspartate carbamoyltransferase